LTEKESKEKERKKAEECKEIKVDRNKGS